MTLFLCKLWPYLAGGLIGWLLAGWLARRLKYGEPPVEKIVEKHIDRVVDNPKHLSLISKLENENSQIPGLLSKVAGFESARSNTREVTVDKVEKIVNVDNPEHLKRISQLEAEIESLKNNVVSTPSASTTAKNTSTYGVASAATASSAGSTTAKAKTSTSLGSTADLSVAKRAGFRLKQKNGKDDFTIVEGIGPKINQLIHDAGINFYADLAAAPVDTIQKILDDAGPRYKLAKPGTWPAQADMAAKNKWVALKTWQDELDGGQ